jgi:hypothetical protein
MDVQIELTKVYRQKDMTLIKSVAALFRRLVCFVARFSCVWLLLGSMLNELRKGICTPATEGLIRATANRALDASDGIQPTRLYSHKADVDQENRRNLEAIKAPAQIFEAHDTGQNPQLEVLTRNCVAPRELVLKKG